MDGEKWHSGSNIEMLKWDGSKWIQLETTELSKDATCAFYEATTGTFSHFAVVGTKSAVIPVVTFEAPEKSTLEAVSALIPQAILSSTLNRIFYMFIVFVIVGTTYILIKKKKTIKQIRT